MHDALLGGRQLVPELLADQHDVRGVDVVGRTDELLHFVELVRQDHRVRILLAVHRPGFQRAVEFGKRHGHRVGVEGLERVQEHRVGNDADLQPGQVFRLGNGVLGVGDVAKAQVPETQRNQAFFGQLGDQGSAQRAIQQRVGLAEVGDREGQVNQPEFLDDARQRRRRGGRHFLHAALQAGLLLHFIAKLRGREFLDLHLAAAFGGKQLGKLLHAGADGVIGIVQVAEADRAFLDVLRGGRHGGRAQDSHQTQTEKGVLHRCLLPGFIGMFSMSCRTR
ncbi:hypothetical protein D3C72_1096900 [compost metagenome]